MHTKNFLCSKYFGQSGFMSTNSSDLEKGIISKEFAYPTLEEVLVSRSASTMINVAKILPQTSHLSVKKQLIRWYHNNSNILLIMLFLLAPGLYVVLTGYQQNEITAGIDVVTWTIAISMSIGCYYLSFYTFKFFVRFARDNIIRSEDHNRVARLQFLMPYIKSIILSLSAFLVFSFYLLPKSSQDNSTVQKVLLAIFVSFCIIGAHKWLLVEFSASYKTFLYGDRLQTVNFNTTAITYLLEVQRERMEASKRLEQSLNKHSKVRKGSGQAIVDTIRDVHLRTKTWKESLNGSKSNPISFKDSPIHMPAFAVNPSKQIYPVMKNKLKFKSADEARKVSMALFDYLKKDSRDHLVPDDFFPLVEKKEKIDSIFEVFDVNGDGSITRRELRQRFVLIYEEFWRLNNSMSTADYALKQLHNITLILILIITCFCWLLVFNYNIQSILVLLSSTALAYVFVFGNSAKNLFDSLIFVFVTQYFFINIVHLIVAIEY